MNHKENKLMPVTANLAMLIATCNFVGLVFVIVSPIVSAQLNHNKEIPFPSHFVWVVPLVASTFTYFSLTGWNCIRKLSRNWKFTRWLVKKRHISRANSFRALFPVLVGGSIAIIFKPSGGRGEALLLMFAYGC